ncbi:MAG: winged helix-turn-helix domain-containing protein [Infirmifilum sp.]
MPDVSLTRLQELVLELRRRIQTYRDELVKNEMLTRYALVDPVLRALGWDLENPREVIPEYQTGEGRSDYALLRDGSPICFVEAKPLGGIKPEDIREKLKYSFEKGVQYTVITDGDQWLVYDVFRRTDWQERKIAEWSVMHGDPSDAALSFLMLINAGTFGKRPQRPIFDAGLERGAAGEAERPAAKIPGPIDNKKAELLVLRVLAGASTPLPRREIVKRAGEAVELTPHDLERLKSGELRWKKHVQWAVTGLKKQGLIESKGANQWVISARGREHLRKLEE